MSIRSKIRHVFHPVQGEIWCLHRVVPDRSRFPSNRELEITPDFLERAIEDYQRKGFRFVSIDGIVSQIGNHPWDLRRKKQVNISFDDGFVDVYEQAFPIFKKHRIPFTVYLVGNFPEGESDLWWIQMEQLVDGDIDTFEGLMKEIYRSDRNMREYMHEKTSSSPDLSLCRKLSLSWDQLREMVDSGLCTIGGHSMTHPGLTRIPKEAICQELSDGKRIVESHLPVTVRHFSYPHSMEDANIQEKLEQLGYETATMGFGGTIRKGDNPYRLNRRYIIQP